MPVTDWEGIIDKLCKILCSDKSGADTMKDLLIKKYTKKTLEDIEDGVYWVKVKTNTRDVWGIGIVFNAKFRNILMPCYSKPCLNAFDYYLHLDSRELDKLTKNILTLEMQLIQKPDEISPIQASDVKP